MKKILMINFGGIGDEILFLPTIVSVKKLYPDSKITLCLEPRSKSIKDLTELIDDIIEIDIKRKDKYFFEIFKMIQKCFFGHFDIVFSSGSNRFIPLLMFLMNIKERYGYDNGFLSRILNTKSAKLNKNQYAAYMYHDLLKPICDLKCELPKIEAGFKPVWALNIQQYREENSVLIHPGVSKMSIEKNIIKTFGALKWAQIIEYLIEKGKKVYLTGGPDDEKIINNILEHLPKNIPYFFNMYGKTKNLKELADLMHKVEVVVCSDSAPMHLSVSCGTKTVAIFGATDEGKLLPKSSSFIPIVASNLQCRPCLWDKRRTTCENLHCLNDISVNQVCSYIL